MSEAGKTELSEVVKEGAAGPAATPEAAPLSNAGTEATKVDPSTIADPDDRALAEAEQAVAREAEETAKAQAASGAAPAAAAPAGGSAAAPASGAQPAAAVKAGGSVPMPVFLRMREEANRWRDRALIESGAARAAAAIAGGGASAGAQAQAAPEPTPEEKLAKLKADKKEIAAKFDAGTLTAAEMTSQHDAIDDEIFAIRQAAIQAPAAAPVALDSRVEEHANTLVDQHPVLVHLKPETIEKLTGDAYEVAALEGRPIGTGALETMRLRETVAKLATERYAKFYIKEGAKPAQGAAAAGAALPAAGGAPAKAGALSDDAQARDAKLRLQERMPPDATRIGAPDSGTGQSEAELAASLSGLSEDEQIRRLEAVPALVQRMTGLQRL